MPSITKPEDRVPLIQKLAYGAGGPIDVWSVWIFLSLVYPIFNMELKMDPLMIGVILLVFRLWDAVSDPIMGYISDNTRTRWGRRRPYLVVGAFLVGLTYPLMWWAPRSFGEQELFWWLIITGIFFYTCFTFYNMPYQSLLLEMTPDYNERTRVTGVRAIVSKFAGLGVGWAWWLTQRDVFRDPVTGEVDAVEAMRVISIGIGLMILVLGILPGLLVKERYYEHGFTRQQKKVSLWRSLSETLSNVPFLILMAIATLYMLGLTVVDALGKYIATYYVLGGDKAEASTWDGLGGTITFITGLVSIPVFTSIASRIGKNKALGIALGLVTLGTASSWFFYIPDQPMWMMLYYFTRGTGTGAIWLLIPSIQADVVDHDELQTGERREGAFASIFSWTLKLGLSLAYGLSGPILAMTGFDIELESNQAEGVMLNLRLAFCLVPTIAMLVTAYLLYIFPLTPARSAEIREQLEARRGKV
ncbi:MFS transporter [Mucisphaera calidilacus]|uniref:Glucuronide carrier protein n=1 Tax=Mucisphaera calidilacus TaxID=2527982 RepID=A0A518BU67_9BACT|nr:MFS transporter [Mucisphaera calidilacus]QDU70519.1 Glucuronide carrier protein [Mucisphaera calidilacus]